MVTNEQREALIAAACEARQRAYAPYSHYAVGAALLVADGRIITGVNVENAAYGLTNCAERTAVFKMVSEGIRTFQAAGTEFHERQPFRTVVPGRYFPCPRSAAASIPGCQSDGSRNAAEQRVSERGEGKP